MSNNVNITEGTGKTVASEDVGGIQFQKVEIYGKGGASVLAINPDGSLNASIVGTVNIAGSVIAVVTSNPNQSVSGAVNVSGSVLLGSSNASIIATLQGSVATIITGGSIATVASGNQSISGAVNVSGSVLLGSSNASVIALVQGSVAATQTGTRITSVVSSTPSSMLAGASIFGQLPGGTAMLGSVVAYQGVVPWTIGSVYGNISGSVAATVTNTVTVVSSISGGIFPISGSVAATVTNTNLNVGGSVVAFQGAGWSGSVAATIVGTPNVNTAGSVAAWLNSSNASVISYVPNSVATVIIGGSIAASFTPPANQSVSGAVNITGSVMLGNSNASVIATIQGSVAVAIISGSVAVATGNSSVQLLGGSAVIGSVATLQGTNPWIVTSSIAGGIFPISGSVAATIVGTPNVNVAGSVVAFQGGAPWANTNVGSVITVSQGSIAAVIIGGSVAVATGNSSVQLLGSSAVIGSVATLQGTNPWLVASSIAGGIFPISGSVAATITNTNVNVSGSVAAWLQSTNASVITVGTAAPNQSVSGTVQTDVRSSVAVVIIGGSVATATTNSSVMLLNGANTIGSVTALQGTNPWIQTFSNSSILAVPVGSTIAVLQSSSIIGVVTGSVLAIQSGTRISSISGTVTVSEGADSPSAIASILVGVTANTNGSVLTVTGYQMAAMQITSGPGASITGQVNFEGTLDGTQFVPINGYNPATNAIASGVGVESDWMFNVAGLQGIRGRVSNWSVGSITARAVASPEDARTFAVAAHSVSGTVNLGIGGTMIGSVAAYQGAIPWTIGSVYGNISGSVAAFQAGTWSQSVMTLQITSIATAGQVMGSVATLQGTNPWNVAGSVAAFVVGSSSIITTNVGSVIVMQQAPSIVGTYSVAGTHAAGDKGLYILGARNDALASILGADGTFVNPTIGPVGETVVANSPITKWVQGTGSILGGVPLTGGSMAVIAAQGASIFTYITGIQIINAGATTQWIRFDGATSSTIGYGIAPAGGGSNMILPNAWKTNANGAFTASISGTGSGASVYLAVQGFISKT